LILDEATTALNGEAGSKFYQNIQRIAKNPYCFHDYTDLSRSKGRLILVRKGVLKWNKPCD